MIAEIITALTTAVVGAVIWGVRLEGRINAGDVRAAETEKLLLERHATVLARLSRIDNKMDAVLEYAIKKEAARG